MTRPSVGARAPVPRAEGAGGGHGRCPSSPTAPARRSGASSSSPPRCSRPRSTAATATAARAASRPPASRRARRSRSSTSAFRPRSAATRSCISASSTSSPAARTSSCSGPPGTGKSHLAIAIGIRACLAGHRVAFRTATEWVALLADAQRQGRLDDELARLQRIPLLIVDEVGYIPFDPQAANLMFMLVSRRYERASADRHLQQAVQRPGARSSATTSSPPR